MKTWEEKETNMKKREIENNEYKKERNKQMNQQREM